MSRVRIVLSLVLSLAVPASVSAAQAPAGTEAAQSAAAAANLELAGVYLEAGEHAKARALVETAVTAAPAIESSRREAALLLRRILEAERAAAAADRARVRARERIVLQEAARLNAEGNFDDAAKLLREKLDEFSGPALMTAQTRLIDAHPGWLREKWFVLVHDGWVGDALVVTALLLLAWGLVQWVVRPLVGGARRHRGAQRWKVEPIPDSSSLGAGALLLASLHRWSQEVTPETSGLLLLQRMQVQAIPVLEAERPRLDIAAALAPLPAFGGVQPSAVAKAVQSLKDWAVPSGAALVGECSTAGSRIAMRLTARHRDGSVVTFAEDAETTVESCRKAAESISFKMYYLIANGVSEEDAEAADRLRLGLQRLQSHVTTGDPRALEEAGELFSAVRRDSPLLEDAYLFEGVALDLLERHDEAERLFHYLVERTRRDSLRKRARYNEAIAKFRKYRPGELELAITSLGELAGGDVVARFEEESDFGHGEPIDPVQALSLAARINGIAHRLIFWQPLALDLASTDDPREVVRRKREARPIVEGWMAVVQRVAGRLQELRAKPEWRSREGWDETILRQLEWAIDNARGNAYLNCASSFLVEPFLPGAGEPELRGAYFQQALARFQECELLLSGVETLTNLATTYLYLGQAARTRQYALEAIKRNPSYEYAYYRLAEAWEFEHDDEKVKETLASFPRTATITEFLAIFTKYGVKPKAA